MADKRSITSKENGKKGGREKGVLNQSTIEKQTHREVFKEMVVKRLRPLFEAQYSLAQGVQYLIRIDESAEGGREHTVVTDPDEIGDILAQMSEGEPGVYNDKYYYITVKPPENKAIDSMLDRALGKASQPLTGEGGGPVEITVVKYAKDETPTTPPIQA